MNIQTPTIAVTTALNHVLNTSPADLQRQNSGKQVVLDAEKAGYLFTIDKKFTTGTVIYFPLDSNFLNETSITKDKVIALWQKLNKSEPDQKYTKTMKNIKKLPLQSLEKLPMTYTKFDKIRRFLPKAETLAKNGKAFKSAVVPVNPAQKVEKATVPELRTRATKDTQNLMYPALDCLLEGIPPEEFRVSKIDKESKYGWSLWTTDDSEKHVAILCTKSERIAHTIVEFLKTIKIAACISREKDTTNTFITACINVNEPSTRDLLKKGNKALIAEYNRLVPDIDKAVEMARKKISFMKI